MCKSTKTSVNTPLLYTGLGPIRSHNVAPAHVSPTDGVDVQLLHCSVSLVVVRRSLSVVVCPSVTVRCTQAAVGRDCTRLCTEWYSLTVIARRTAGSTAVGQRVCSVCLGVQRVNWPECTEPVTVYEGPQLSVGNSDVRNVIGAGSGCSGRQERCSWSV